jgi:hypothetical protein
MPGLFEQISALSKRLVSGPMPRMSEAVFDVPTSVPGASNEIVRDGSYFGLTVNQINLLEGRELFSTYDPLVYIAVDFVHGRERIVIPKLIGPAALRAGLPEGHDQLPHGFDVGDIRVAGPHPYRGGQVGITVVLYRVRKTDYAKRVLQIAEGLSNAIGLPAEMSTLTKIGNSVVDSVEALFGMEDSEPLLGRRVELNASPIDGFRQRAVALFRNGNPPDPSLKVLGGRLQHSMDREYSGSDFVLYTVWRSESNENERGLTFYPQVERMLQDAAAGDETSWLRAKSTLIAIYQQMLTSADLTASDADRLFSVYKQDVLEARKRPLEVSLMGTHGDQAAHKSDLERNQLNARALEIIELPDPRKQA